MVNKISRIKEILNILERSSGQIFNPPRGKWIQINPHNYKDELDQEFFDLINIAYKPIGGHANIQKPSDVFDPEVDYWQGIDLHDDSDFDVIIFGKRTNFGIKSIGVGHDGSKEASRAYLDGKGASLAKKGNYIEASGKLAEILMNKYKVPVVNDPDVIKKILKKDIEFFGKHPEDDNATGDGWYSRMLGGHKHFKIMLGNPNI